MFAQLYGTVELLDTRRAWHASRGLVINKFRGDAAYPETRPIPCWRIKTHLPVLGVVPYLRVDIEDEDSLSSRLESNSRRTNRWIPLPFCGCRISLILRILCRWSSTRC